MFPCAWNAVMSTTEGPAGKRLSPVRTYAPCTGRYSNGQVTRQDQQPEPFACLRGALLQREHASLERWHAMNGLGGQQHLCSSDAYRECFGCVSRGRLLGVVQHRQCLEKGLRGDGFDSEGTAGHTGHECPGKGCTSDPISVACCLPGCMTGMQAPHYCHV